MTYRKILVGVDLHQGDRVAGQVLEAESQVAIDEAILLAIHTGGSITFCTSLQISAHTATLIEQDHQNLLRSVEDVAAERLDRVVAEATAKGVQSERIIRFGTPAVELATLADEGDFDLLVVGTRSRNSATRLLFGSTAHKLMRTAPCAVWVVKPESTREIREIAVATDLSDVGRSVVSAAVQMARALQAKLFVLHAVEIGELSSLLLAGVTAEEIATARDRMTADAEAAIQQQLSATDYRTLPHGVKIELIEGAPDHVIPPFITDNQIDILVIGTHGRSGISRLILGNMAERILPVVDCSVIAVKPSGFGNPVATEA